MPVSAVLLVELFIMPLCMIIRRKRVLTIGMKDEKGGIIRLGELGAAAFQRTALRPPVLNGDKLALSTIAAAKGGWLLLPANGGTICSISNIR